MKDAQAITRADLVPAAYPGPDGHPAGRWRGGATASGDLVLRHPRRAMAGGLLVVDAHQLGCEPGGGARHPRRDAPDVVNHGEMRRQVVGHHRERRPAGS